MNLSLKRIRRKLTRRLEKAFKDFGDINYYAKASVLAVAKKGYIQGAPIDPNDLKKGFVFEPKSNLLRSDAAIIIGKVLVGLKRLPKLELIGENDCLGIRIPRQFLIVYKTFTKHLFKWEMLSIDEDGTFELYYVLWKRQADIHKLRAGFTN